MNRALGPFAFAKMLWEHCRFVPGPADERVMLGFVVVSKSAGGKWKGRRGSREVERAAGRQ